MKPTLLLFIIASMCASAQTAETGLTFLKRGVGARNIAMGESGVAGFSDGFSMYYNPALPASARKASIALMHNQWVQDVSGQYIGAVVPLESWSLGFHASYASVDDIEAREKPGPADGTFTASNFSTGLTASFHISDDLAFGLTAKYLFEKIFVDVADGYAFDFGVTLTPFTEGDLTGIVIGISLQNLGSMSELRSVASELPAHARYGVSYSTAFPWTNGTLRLATDGVSFFKGSTHLHIGAEVDYSEMFFLRLGYQHNYDLKNVSLGIGASYSLLRFDYSFVPFLESFGTSHTIALNIVL